MLAGLHTNCRTETSLIVMENNASYSGKCFGTHNTETIITVCPNICTLRHLSQRNENTWASKM